MTKKKNIIIAVITVLAVIASVFAGCNAAKNSDDEQNTSNNTSVTAPAQGMTGNITVVSREEGSGTRDAFTELMAILDENENDATIETAEITNSTSVMMSTVNGNEKAIGYVSLGSLSDTVKAVSLDGVAPSTDTVKDGTYKLQRPFNIAYIESSLSDLSKDFISFIMSKQGQSVINDEGYIGIDTDTEYKASGLSGTVTLAGSTSVAPVMNVLADKYKELNPNVKIQIQESGSSAGIESAINGAVDIAMSSRDLKDDELKTLEPQKIALDGIAVIVNTNNAVSNLTAEQVKSIYTGAVTTWDEIK
ncbi:MAG: substrate-binding domain-containing protein [Eubacterium sp.]